MKTHQILFAMIFLLFLVGCLVSPAVSLAPIIVTLPLPTPSLTLSPVPTQSPTPTSTERPLTLIFYGDSVLKVGDTSKQGAVGFSMVDSLHADLNPADQIITSNHGGRKAQWGYENLDNNILVYNPDIVTIWWGSNDLDGCPGIFDRNTNKILQYKLNAMLDKHLMYMKLQIDVLLSKNIPVMVITPIPILGTLPWSHISPDNKLVWEINYRCNFNTGMEQLVEGQRKLVADYVAEQKPVYLVDAWQIYKEHPNTDNMYMDIIHPGSYGVKFIAERWLQVFQSIKR